jgi:hypothetical protein
MRAGLRAHDRIGTFEVQWTFRRRFVGDSVSVSQRRSERSDHLSRFVDDPALPAARSLQRRVKILTAYRLHPIRIRPARPFRGFISDRSHLCVHESCALRWVRDRCLVQLRSGERPSVNVLAPAGGADPLGGTGRSLSAAAGCRLRRALVNRLISSCREMLGYSFRSPAKIRSWLPCLPGEDPRAHEDATLAGRYSPVGAQVDTPAPTTVAGRAVTNVTDPSLGR